MNNTALKLILVLISLLSASITTRADIATVQGMMCPDAELWGSKMISGICWSCLFPMRIFGKVEFGDEGDIPVGSVDDILCSCPGEFGIPDYGFTVGLWSPSRLVELVRKPYCAPSLGGTTLRESFRQMGRRDGGESSDNQFYNYHWYSYPLLEIIELLITPECNAGGFSDFDLMYMSEVDPTWSEDELALFTNPEAAVAANPLLMAACPADCAAATFGEPLESLWWCAGCWGHLYPFTGNVPSGGSMPRVTSLLATRAAASLHRRGLAWSTMGRENLCGGSIYPMLPKRQYKLSQFFPLPEADNTRVSALPSISTGDGDIDTFSWDKGCCHYMGVPTMLWGEWRNIPATGEDAVHVLFRWTDCCVR